MCRQEENGPGKISRAPYHFNITKELTRALIRQNIW